MQNLPSDIQEFLESYPNGSDDRSLSDNLQFYSNRLRCRPDNLLVEQIHERCVVVWRPPGVERC